MMKIAVAGTGYVGLSLATLLALNNEVIAIDVIKEKVDLINKHISPIQDKEIEDYLANKNLNLLATLDSDIAYKDADYVIIATPTNYDSVTNKFDTSSVESVIGQDGLFKFVLGHNHKRLYPSLGYLSPITYKNQSLAF